MIDIRFSPDRNELKIRGHAEYAEKGKDIVCAAVSFAFHNLCGMLLEYPEEAYTTKPIMKKGGKGGVTSVRCRPSASYAETINHDFYYCLVGLEQIASNYPDYVKLTVTGH